MIEIFWLFLSIKSRINFSTLERYGTHCEQRYRQQFASGFDFFEFNQTLVQQYCGKELAFAFDPSYIPKSGKKTHGLGKYWSGCAGNAKWGLEIGGIAVLDIENHTALHLEAVQTEVKEGQSLLDFYAEVITSRAEKLKKISPVGVFDAYFSKEPFVKAVCDSGLQIISRLRDDAQLQYIVPVVKTGKRGRPKTKGEKVDVKNLDTQYFQQIESGNENTKIYSGIVYAVALKRKVNLVIVCQTNDKKQKSPKIFFSTDLKAEPLKILQYYQMRFQIEFIYRDAKQQTGLTNCQARDKEKLDFHFNISLSSVNLAKVAHGYALDKQQRNEFSLTDIKTMNYNALLIQRIYRMFGLKPNMIKNNQNLKELIYFGTKAV